MLTTKLYSYLKDNKLYVQDCYDLPDDKYVFVIDGDWKHDHIRCDLLVEKFCNDNGYTLIQKYKNVIEEDGSDWYIAEHYYKIVEA